MASRSIPSKGRRAKSLRHGRPVQAADEKRPASNELLEHDPEKWEALARSCSRQPRAG